MKTRMLLASVSIAVACTACESTKPLPQAPQAVQTTRVAPGDTVGTSGLRYSAVVSADAEVPLSFRVPGYVVALQQVRGENGHLRDVAEGDRVRRGSALARIRSSEYEDRVRQASSQAAAVEAVLQKASLDWARAERLFADQSLTKPDFDAARAQYDATRNQLLASRAQISEAQIALRDTVITAPFDGDVVRKSIEPGSFVGSGLPVFTLAKIDTVKIVIGAPDTVMSSIKLGQPVDVTVDAYANRTFAARISRIASAADPKTRNFEVEVAIPNRDHLLKVGMIGSLQLAAPETGMAQTGIHVPLSAILEAPGRKYGVFVVAGSEGGRTARLRPVEIGPIVGTDISITSGLGNGDEVITTGAALLKDGQRVEVVK